MRSFPRSAFFYSLPLVYLSLLSPASQARASEVAVEVAPIVKEGTPGELLMEDPVVTGRSSTTEALSPSGSIQSSLADELPLSINATNRPGNAAQLRGLGRSSEETDVQALGVPLNPPQGGGFDLSVFPQFIWAGYEFQAGPALGAFDPRATAGSLVLTPWSACALSGSGCPGEGPGKGGHGRGSALVSSTRLNQLAVSGTDGESVAVVAGLSTGDATGPSAALSARHRFGSRAAASFHLLGTDLDARTPGPDEITPQAHQSTTRLIPVAQLDLPIGERGVYKASAYYDWSYLRYEDPSTTVPPSRDRIQQAGTEQVLVQGPFKIGVGARRVSYEHLGDPELTEVTGNIQASVLLEPGSFVIEPVVRGSGVSRYGILPEASLGVRQELGGPAWFARLGMSRKFPSLMNRFYSYPGFPGYPGYAGNPAVQPERDWTAVVGAEYKSRVFDASVEVFGQLAEDTQVRAPLDPSTETLVNRGFARTVSLLPSITLRPSAWLDLRAGATFTASKVDETGLAFPTVPGFLTVSWLDVHSPGDAGARKWSARAIVRSSSASVASITGGVLPPYTALNLEGRFQVVRGWRVGGRLENVFDQRIELISGYPTLSRAFAMLASVEL